MRLLTCLSANRVRSRVAMPLGPLTDSTMIGAASGSALRTSGREPGGRSRSTVARCSLMSFDALSGSISRLNCAITSDTPSVDDDVSVSRPLTVLTASSTFSVTSVSTAVGDAPAYGVTIVTSGKSTFGNLSTPRLR